MPLTNRECFETGRAKVRRDRQKWPCSKKMRGCPLKNARVAPPKTAASLRIQRQSAGIGFPHPVKCDARDARKRARPHLSGTCDRWAARLPPMPLPPVTLHECESQELTSHSIERCRAVRKPGVRHTIIPVRHRISRFASKVALVRDFSSPDWVQQTAEMRQANLRPVSWIRCASEVQAVKLNRSPSASQPCAAGARRYQTLGG
jgi:hypothetical protein